MTEDDLEAVEAAVLSADSRQLLVGDRPDTSGADFTVVAVSEQERALLQGLLTEAYDNLNGAGKGAQAMVAKDLSQRIAEVSTPSGHQN
jgi:hypothetical protein